MDVFDLVAKISLNTDDYERGLDNAGTKTHNFGDKLKSGLATAGKVAGAAITAVTAATTAMSAAMIKGVSETAIYGDNIDKMSQKMGLSAEAYQEWDAVMQHSGTNIESLQAGMKTLANAVENGNDAFERLGISQEQIASMNNEELFSATITALQNVENETERTYLAGQLLGRGATELGALLNTSAEDTQAMKDRVHELGGVMSDEAVKAAAKYQDSLQDMKTSFSGISRGLTSEFLPSITSVMDGLAEIFSGNGDTGIEMITQGVSEFLKNLQKAIPRVIEIGGGIIKALGNAIIKNLPTILKTGAEVITNIASGIVQYLPMLIPAAIEAIVTLATGLTENLPQLIPTIINVVSQITQTLIQNAPRLLSAALSLMASLARGIINSIPNIGKAMLGIVNAIKNAIGEAVNGALSWGKDLIDNFVGGIKSKIDTVKNAVSGVAKTVKNFLGFSEPEEGPLSNFHTYAPDMMQLFAQGITQNSGLIKSAFDKSLDLGEPQIGVKGYTDMSAYTAQTAATAPTASAYGIRDINININGAQYDDDKALAEKISIEIQNIFSRRAAVYA